MIAAHVRKKGTATIFRLVLDQSTYEWQSCSGEGTSKNQKAKEWPPLLPVQFSWCYKTVTQNHKPGVRLSLKIV